MAGDNGDSKKKLSKVEHFKMESGGLYGDIAEELADPKDHFDEYSIQLLKHHGTYQQDNRDTRTERKKQGLGREYQFMLRTKFPGGVISADQYLICDDLSAKYGQDDLRVTSRQCFQFHGVVKAGLKPLIHDLNKLANIMTFGACGDVCRNTMAPVVADIDRAYADCGVDLQEMAQQISAHFLPRTKSYYDLWIDDEKVIVKDDGTIELSSKFEKQEVEEPIYGKAYLPRKFKIALATDFDNSTDVYTNDIGVIAHTEDGKIVGYEILVGGGLGYTHRKPATYARAASHFAYVQHEDVIPIIEAIVKVQRDFGGRADRRHARLKYLIDDWGMDAFREKVFEYGGRAFDPPKNIVPSAQPDYLGWRPQMQDGLNYVGVWVQDGRIKDQHGHKFKTGLNEIIRRFKPSVRLTPHHNVVLADIQGEDIDEVQSILDEYNIPTDKGISPIRRGEMACPALPTCGLALTEAERAMPGLLDTIEEAGHADSDVVIRMTGCPNNCVRPRSAELGIVGSGSGVYVVYTGGHRLGTRLNEPLLEKITADNLPAVVTQLLDAWKEDRTDGEEFGVWSHRVGVDALRERITEKLEL